MATPNFDKAKYDQLSARGMPSGIGTKEKACIMACLNLACGGTLTDAAESPCVHPFAARFAIRLNDSAWSSEHARARGLYDLGLALLGTDAIDGRKFLSQLAEQTIRQIVPMFLIRAGLNDYAEICKAQGSAAAAAAAASYAAASYADAADAAASAASYAADDAAAAAAAAYAASYAAASYADAADAAASADAAAAAYAAAYRIEYGDETLILSAKIASKILNDMRSELP